MSLTENAIGQSALDTILDNRDAEGIVSQALTNKGRIELAGLREPIPMLLTCPSCGERHIDEFEFATKVHHTHACQSCGMCWRPAVAATVGVRFLPGYKNAVIR